MAFFGNFPTLASLAKPGVERRRRILQPAWADEGCEAGGFPKDRDPLPGRAFLNLFSRG
jgi:hypothetical protein